MRRTHRSILFATVIAWPLLAAAQPAAPPRPEGKGAATPRSDTRPRDRARTYLVVRIADALNLTDEDALKVSAVIRDSDQHRRQLVQHRLELEEKLHAALAKSPLDNTELTKLIAAGNDLDQQLALVPEETFRALQKILSVEQQARLILFRREVQGEVRRALQRRSGGGRKTEKRRGSAATDD